MSAEPLPGGVWACLDAGPAARALRGSGALPEPQQQRRRLRWVVEAALPLTLATLATMAVLLPADLAPRARLSLWVFTMAIVLWSATSINAAYVALGAVLVLVLFKASPQERLFDALAADVIWLMIGAFVLGAAIEKTGLAARLTQLVVGRARTVRGVFWLLATVSIPLSFVIPSTSGRAAVALPVFRAVSSAANDKKVTRALALLIPTVILVATIATLIGAGSHLIANDLLGQIAARRIGFARWAVCGTPFAVASAYAACAVILHVFLDRERRDRPVLVLRSSELPAVPRLSLAEWATLGVLTGMIGLWMTEARHGIEIATVTVAGALVLTLPGRGGVLSWKEGLKAVSWNLVLFVGASLVLGRELIASGAAQWIIDRLFGLFALDNGDASANGTKLVPLLALSFLTLTAHVYMTSHTARAAALVPPLLYLAGSLKLDPTAVLFLGTLGMDYCLTFPVSSKALLMFQELDTETFVPADLLRLSALLLLVHLVLIVVFYFTYWRWVGLQL